MPQNNKALKRFGQNYLIDKNIVRKIIDEFNPQPEDKIIEIGPGRGILTSALMESGADLTAVEIDFRVIEDLSKTFPRLTLINKDFLKIDLKELAGKNYNLRIIGNIPYNITSPIIFKLIEDRELVSDALFMVQYEVAKRMTAEKRTKDYSILSVILDYFTETKFCFKVPPTVFRPQPKVNSAVVKINFKKFEKEVEDRLFINTVKASFGNRRKNLKNSLSNSIFKTCDLSDTDIDITKRAEELSTEDFIRLAKFLRKGINERYQKR